MKAIVPAKLTRPSSKGALPRERLFKLIERGREKKVIWISGPAGSGKTTLAASYFDYSKALCFWYQVDEGDADLATFFYYLGLAAENAAPRYRKPMPLLTPEYHQAIPVFAKRYFEQLGERLRAKTSSRLSAGNRCWGIVFDNYQDVPGGSMFHDVVSAGLSSLPDALSVIILSRSEPPPPYARLHAVGEMSLLSWDDIRLTADESNVLALFKAGRDLHGETLSQLYQTTDGWATGLVLLMESLQVRQFDFQLPRGLGREEIFGYFATELFDRSSQEIRSFLLETSFLPKMNARMAEELTGNARAGRIFSDLNRKNYFTNRYASLEPVFQYHPLFREFLLVKAEATMPPEYLQHLRRRAAQVLEANGCSEDAVSLFCEAEEWSEATRVILTHARGLIAQGRWQTLQGWIEALPAPVTGQNPWMLFWLGVCRLHSSPDESRGCFERAFERFRRGRDAAGSFLALSGMFDVIGHRLDTFVEFDRLIPMMNELLEEYPQFPSPEIEARVVNSMLYALILRQPHHPDLGNWERCGLALIRDPARSEIALRILLSLAYRHLFSGDLEQVALLFDSFQKRVEDSQNAPLAVTLLESSQAFYYWLSADFEKNRRAVDEGIALAGFTGVHIFDVFLLGHGAAGALSTGEITRAEEYLEKMLLSLQMAPSTWSEGFYHCMKAWSCLLQGCLARASMHADLGIRFCSASGSPQTIAYNHLIKAIAVYELKEAQEAAAHLSEVFKISRTINLPQTEFMAFLVEAQIAFDGGEAASGRDSLCKAMAIGRKHGYANAFFWVGSTMANLCVKALEAGIETDYVQGLVRKRNLLTNGPVQHLETWPWPLKIYTLGRFELVRDGEVVKFSGKVQHKPLLLLKALIAFGGREVKEEPLCDVLWPDAEGDLAHRSFETTLYRLRQLLGKDKAILLSDRRLTLDRQSCWVDAFALDQILNEAEAMWETCRGFQAAPQPSQDSAATAIQLTQRAISMYKGHFFEVDSEQLWALSRRERLRAKYVRGIESLGGYWEALGELEMAIKCYEKGLEVDDLAEEFYQHLMLCYQRLGRRAKVFSVYHRCRSVLGARLGLEPSAKTESLLDRFRSRR